MIDSRLLAGRYELRQRIGMGGMAQVWLAHDRVLNRDVAIKILGPEAASDPSFTERFRREAQAAAQINHPSIVRIYDWGQTQEPDSEHPVSFMVMEFVPGPTLKETLTERGPLPEAEALRITAQIAAALEVAHQHGIIHRDIKPHNVLLDPFGHVKVVDFGIARTLGMAQLTKTNAMPGTVQYSAPEQVRRQPVDARTDLYSLGVLLYELLTGRVPFTGESPIAVALQHVETAPVPPSTVRPGISLATDAVVMKALAKDPGARFASAQEMERALETAYQRLKAPPPTPKPPTPARPRAVAGEATQRVPLPASKGDRGFPWMVALPLLLALLVGVGVLATGLGSSLLGSGHHNASGRSPGKPVARATARPRTAAAAQPAVKKHPRPAAKPAPAGEVPPQVVATAPPPSAAAAPPAPTVPPPVVPTQIAASALPASSAPSISAGTAGPVTAVRQFYSAINNHDWGSAYGFWDSNMQSRWGYQGGIVDRFSPTQQISIQKITPVAVDSSAGTADVQVQMVELYGTPPVTRYISGTWHLVRGSNGWLLDSENLSMSTA